LERQTLEIQGIPVLKMDHLMVACHLVSLLNRETAKFGKTSACGTRFVSDLIGILLTISYVENSFQEEEGFLLV